MVLPAAAQAAPKSVASAYDHTMRLALGEYLVIQRGLAADRTKRLSRPAKRIERVALKALGTSGLTAHRRWGLRTLVEGARQLRRGKTLAAKRRALRDISRPLAVWAVARRLAGIDVVHSAHAKAVWLQRSFLPLRNPYFGKTRVASGTVVAGPRKGEAFGAEDPHPTSFYPRQIILQLQKDARPAQKRTRAGGR